MQLSIATEILSECIGDVSNAKNKILPKNGSRRKRMNTFLQFILQEDYNVIVFEEMLKNSGLEELFDFRKYEDNKTTKDVGMLCILISSLYLSCKSPNIITQNMTHFMMFYLCHHFESF